MGRTPVGCSKNEILERAKNMAIVGFSNVFVWWKGQGSGWRCAYTKDVLIVDNGILVVPIADTVSYLRVQRMNIRKERQ